MSQSVAPVPEDFMVEESYEAGRIDVASVVDPLSLQAATARKSAFKDALRSAVAASTTLMFVHDVELTMIWYVDEARRYQTHLIADIDNVIKPILDAMTGPTGVLIDDNQIQSIRVSWRSPTRQGLAFDVVLQALHPDHRVRRAGLSFVEFTADRCYLLPGGLSEGARTAVVRLLRNQVRTSASLLGDGVLPEVAAQSLPLTRPFPRARLGAFPISPEGDFSDREL